MFVGTCLILHKIHPPICASIDGYSHCSCNENAIQFPTKSHNLSNTQPLFQTARKYSLCSKMGRLSKTTANPSPLWVASIKSAGDHVVTFASWNVKVLIRILPLPIIFERIKQSNITEPTVFTISYSTAHSQCPRPSKKCKKNANPRVCLFDDYEYCYHLRHHLGTT